MLIRKDGKNRWLGRIGTMFRKVFRKVRKDV